MLTMKSVHVAGNREKLQWYLTIRALNCINSGKKSMEKKSIDTDNTILTIDLKE